MEIGSEVFLFPVAYLIILGTVVYAVIVLSGLVQLVSRGFFEQPKAPDPEKKRQLKAIIFAGTPIVLLPVLFMLQQEFEAYATIFQVCAIVMFAVGYLVAGLLLRKMRPDEPDSTLDGA